MAAPNLTVSDASTRRQDRGDARDIDTVITPSCPAPALDRRLQAVKLLSSHREGLGIAPIRDQKKQPKEDPPSHLQLAISDSTSPISREIEWADHQEALRSQLLTILGPLDEDGGMGGIALAWHQDKGEVILKWSRKSDSPLRFDRERRLHHKLSDPQIVAAYHTFRIRVPVPVPVRPGAVSDGFEEIPVLIVAYVPGPSLDRLIKANGPMPWREATRCVREAAQGLMHAHQQGIVHRDVKPSNLMQNRRGRNIVVIDWGLALERNAANRVDDGLTESRAYLGTPEYCAPEQANDATSATPASDQYSLGCVWHELLTGRRVFPVDRKQQAKAHAQHPIPSLPPSLNVPADVERMMRKLLSKVPEDRYPSMAELIAEIDQVLGGSRLPEPPKPPPIQPGSRFKLYRRLLLGGAAIAILAALTWGAQLQLAPSGPPSVLELTIELTDTTLQPTRSGTIGEQTFEAREGDQITLFARLSIRAYAYLIACRPDGEIEIWSPDSEQARPERTATPRFPTTDMEKSISLTHGEGLQAIAVITSDRQLPPFEEWRKTHGPIPWRKSIPADPGVVWRYDGDRIRTLTAEDDGTKGSAAGSLGVRGAIARVVEWLEKQPGVDAVYLKAFPVR